MPTSEVPCLSLAIAPLRTAGNFAIHITKAPHPSGYVLYDTVWKEGLTHLWYKWQDMFSARSLPNVPHISEVSAPLTDPLPLNGTTPAQPISLGGRLMQELGVNLWQWLFDGPIQGSFRQSLGIAIGQGKPLRLKLEIRDPDLIALPWEIMQDAPGKQAISLSQQLLFSRTTSDVHTLPVLRPDHTLKILLVLGQDSEPGQDASELLKLEQEAEALARVLQTSGSTGVGGAVKPPCQVDTLVQPTPTELIGQLENQTYNIFFYAGHGMPAPDGGLLFLRPDQTLNGTELAQVLTRCQVRLAVFNACWGAQPDHQTEAAIASSGLKPTGAIPRSSLAEVLIHHGVPAVLGMRDSITDEEALSFVQALAKALAERMAIDQAVAVARQHLLTIYRFNQQAWTLPVLYMHPEFDGELLKPLEGSLTALPGPKPTSGQILPPTASLRSLRDAKVWQIREGVMRVGRDRSKNDLVLDKGEVSREHALIVCRQLQPNGKSEATYFLQDFSRFGTWILEPNSNSNAWQQIIQQEVPLQSGMKLKFGSAQNEVLEFVIHPNPE